MMNRRDINKLHLSLRMRQQFVLVLRARVLEHFSEEFLNPGFASLQRPKHHLPSAVCPGNAATCSHSPSEFPLTAPSSFQSCVLSDAFLDTSPGEPATSHCFDTGLPFPRLTVYVPVPEDSGAGTSASITLCFEHQALQALSSCPLCS